MKIFDEAKALVDLNVLTEILCAAAEPVLKGHGFSRAKEAIKHLAFRR